MKKKQKKQLTDAAIYIGIGGALYWLYLKGMPKVPVTANSTTRPLAYPTLPTPAARPTVVTILSSFKVKTRQHIPYMFINRNRPADPR